jgi:hypothetical protein
MSQRNFRTARFVRALDILRGRRPAVVMSGRMLHGQDDEGEDRGILKS